MLKMPKICALNAKYSNRQYRCTFTGVSNYIKISTVVDYHLEYTKYLVSNYIKISTVVDKVYVFKCLMFQITSKFLLL